MTRVLRRTGRRAAGPLASTIPITPPGAPLVAIVVTTHNESGLVIDCLRSIQGQMAGEWECVVMDDASTDDTVEVVRGTVGGDPRFRVLVSDRNTGLSRQRNAGVAATTAPFVTFLDGDDFLYSNAIGSRVAPLVADDHPALAGVFCNWVEVAEGARPGSPPTKRRLPRVTWLKGTNVEGVPFIASAPVMRREAFEVVGGFRSVAVSEDVDLWQRMLRRGFFFDSVKEVGVAYRQRSNSMLRRGSVESARLIADLVAANSAPLPPGTEVGPFVCREPYYAYPPRLMFVRRLVRAMAFEAAFDADITEHLRAIEGAFEAHMEWTLDLPRVISSTSRLAALATGDPASRLPVIERRLADALEPVIERSRAVASAWRSQPPEGPLDTGDCRRTEVSG